jgi:hypothetical protein
MSDGLRYDTCLRCEMGQVREQDAPHFTEDHECPEPWPLWYAEQFLSMWTSIAYIGTLRERAQMKLGLMGPWK